MLIASLNGEEQFQFKLPTEQVEPGWMTLGSVHIKDAGTNEFSLDLKNIKGKVAWKALHFNSIILEKSVE